MLAWGAHGREGALPMRENPPQRRYCRYPVNLPVTAFVYWDETLSRPIPGRCHVLSRSGAGGTFADQIEIGEIILLQLTETLKVYATVRNLQGFKHGMEFVLLRQPQKEALRKLCERFAPAPAPAELPLPIPAPARPA